MAKHDWKQLQAQFLAENEQTGITAKEWCKKNGLNYQSARRYIKVRKTAQSECAIKPTQKKSAQTAQKHKNAQKAKSDKCSKKSAKDSSSLTVCDTSAAKLNGRDNKGRFAEGNPGNPNPPANFKPGNLGRRHKKSPASARLVVLCRWLSLKAICKASGSKKPTLKH